MVHFQSLYGHDDDQEQYIADWSYKPNNSYNYIPQQPLPIHMNLWLFNGKQRTDSQEVEVIVSKFMFTPCP